MGQILSWFKLAWLHYSEMLQELVYYYYLMKNY